MRYFLINCFCNISSYASRFMAHTHTFLWVYYLLGNHSKRVFPLEHRNMGIILLHTTYYFNCLCLDEAAKIDVQYMESILSDKFPIASVYRIVHWHSTIHSGFKRTSLNLCMNSHWLSRRQFFFLLFSYFCWFEVNI